MVIIYHKEKYFKKYFNILDISYKVKKIIHNYVDNEIRILKYKNMFEESIEFKFDENNDEIEKVNIKFFKEESNLQKDFSEKEMKKIKKLNSNFLSCNKNNNLFYIISLLKKEQYDYNRLINTIEKIEIFNGLPIILLFKYYLFFDIFEGGKIPENVANKLNMAISNYNGIYSNNITSTTYSLLIKKLKKQNYMKNSKFYNIFQYKKELRIKYFSETFALMLGYKQKDLINEKLDVLMPKEFCKSHQNMVKRLLINEQLKYLNPDKGKVFDSTGTKIYTVKVEGIMIYELSKNLMFIAELYFLPDNEYIFMLNNNFQLLAHTKNFENEYSLNYTIFQNYNLKILDVFGVKSNKLYKHFSEEFKNIHYQKYIRQARVEEYFTPQLFVPQGDKNIGIMNQNYFNSVKNNILSKIVGKNKDNNLLENNNNEEEEEINKLIENEKSQKIINDFFINSGQIIFHSTFYLKLNKKKFIESLAKELSKIPDTDLMFEGDKINYNLILRSKLIIQKLLTKKDLSNNFIQIEIKLSYFYDKPFYFISVYDKKKSIFKINKSELLLNSNYMSIFNSNSNNNLTRHRSIINDKIFNIKNKFTNKKYMTSNPLSNIKDLKIPENKNSIIEKNRNITNSAITKGENILEHFDSLGIDKTLEKMEKYKNKINSIKLIRLIKYVLSIICIIVLIIYIIILEYQENNIELIHMTFQCYYYNLYSKNIILHFQTVIIEKFYDLAMLNNTFTTEDDYKFVIKGITPILKEGFHYFTSLYYSYNLVIGYNLNLMFKKRDYRKLGGFWEEIIYPSEYPTEMDSVIYNIYSILEVDENYNEIMSDVHNFLFKKGIEKRDNKTRVYSTFIKLVYYFDVNYEFTWSYIFDSVDKTILNNYKEYVNFKLKSYYALEVIGLAFIIVFYTISLVYLYYTNSIIIKNIIFLFLDFTENSEQMVKNGDTKIMMMKLIEFKNCIIDFSIGKLNNYAKNLDDIEENKINSVSFNKTYTGLNSTFERTDSISRKNKNNERKNNLSFKKLDEGPNRKDSLKNIKNLSKDESLNHTNSSVNYLNRTNSSFIKDKLNSNINNLVLTPSQNSTNQNNSSIGKSNSKILNVQNINNENKNDLNRISSRLYRKVQKDNNIINNNDKSSNDSKELIHDILLNKSNKSYIFLIRIYSLIVQILLTAIISYSVYKLVNTIKYHNNYENIFYVFNVLTNRYLILNYYYNTLKATIVFPIEKQLEVLNNSMNVFIEMNGKYNQIMNNDIKKFSTVRELFNIIQDSKNNSTEIMIKDICLNVELCIKYLNSPYNIMVTGIDFLYQSTFIDINKIYLDYKGMSNKTDIQKIRELIVNNKFIATGYFIEYAYFYIKSTIFEAFKNDEEGFRHLFTNNMRILNLITVIFAIFSFLFVVVFIFITISIYAEPIKRASFRISRSFYYIKKYNFLINRKTITQ